VPASDLQTGPNTITITVTNQQLTDAEGGPAAATPDNNPGGLIFNLTVNEKDCGQPPPPACDASNTVQNFVSDTTDTYFSTILAPGNAVPTYVHPAWAPATGDLAGATWIWDSALVTDPSHDETVVFTKHFTVTGTNIESGDITFAADNGYKIVLNGHVID